MNKKKLVISLLILVMVLTLALTALVGCGPKDEDKDTPPAGYSKMATPLSEALNDAIYNTSDGKDVSSIKMGAELRVAAKYGDAACDYRIKFGANVALKADDANKTTFGLSIVDAKANNANILNVYYTERPDESTEEGYKTGEGTLFLDLGKQKFAVDALSIKSVMKSENVVVDDESVTNDVLDALGDALEKMQTVFSLGKTWQSNDKKEVLFRLNLAQVLENANDLLEGLEIEEYTGQLGLALKTSDIKTLLPSLTLDLHFKMDGAEKDKFEDAKFMGVDAKLNLGTKDLKLTRTDETNFVRINLDKNTELGLGLDFKFGGDVTVPYIIGSAASYKAINAINFTAGGELEVKKPIEVTLNLNGEKKLGIPTGTYTVNIAADLNPVGLLGTSFKSKNTDETLSLISKILTNVVDYLSIEIKDKDHPEDEDKQLIISLKKIYTSETTVDLNVNLTNLALLGDLGAMFPSGTVKLGRVIDIVKGFLPKEEAKPEIGSGNASGNVSGNVSGDLSGAPSGDDKKDGIDIQKLMKTLAPIIKNLTILVNCDGKLADVDFKNYSVASNIWKATETQKNEKGEDVEVEVIDEKTGKQKEVDLGDTTLDATVVADKTGIVLQASIKNIIINAANAGKAAAGSNAGRLNVSAKIEANKNGITVTAKSATSLTGEAQTVDFGGGIAFPIDVVFKFNQFKIGNASDANA
ncbi:MAG: hypothetical protein K2M75_00905 [Clostridia bacterium]|nr:hypothetical protein [Clostridia bacterium]